MKKLLSAFSLLWVSLSLFAQTNISGIINSYGALDSIKPTSCGFDYYFDDASGFSVGDTVIIMQMKGATINQTNTAAFGDPVLYNQAGKYEKNVIATKVGNVLTFGLQLSNTYDVNSLVQIISVPHYAGNVNVNGTLTALDWNGSKGGVLAFSASGNVSLSANIDVQAKGFLGGVDAKSGSSAILATTAGCIAITQGCVGSDYFYPAASTYAVVKGEGIAANPSGYEAGKGKMINGGGGGGMSYGGGGGGSNGGSGGMGGGCNNDECSDIFCSPCNYSKTAGQGGFNLTGQYNNVNNRIFLGGGGGAGNHGNSSVNYFNLPNRNGLDGGGIVMISANQLIGNSYTINAKGGDGLPNTVSNTGGTGAGGAGGTVLLDLNLYTTNVLVDVRGGRGHDAHIVGNSSRTAGAGGGGGGGVIWSQAALPGNVITLTNGGLQGLSYNDNGAQAGWNGVSGTGGYTLSGLSIPINPTPSSGGTPLSVGSLSDTIFLCQGQDYTFTIGATPNQSYQWQIDSTGVWENLSVGPNFAEVDTNDGFWILNVDSTLSHFYRLVVYNSCDSVFSVPTFMQVNGTPVVVEQPTSQLTCEGGTASFTAEVSFGVSYQWQQLVGATWTDLNNDTIFSGTATDSMYLMDIPNSINSAIFRLEITSPCGSAFTNPVFLNLAPSPITIDDFSANVTACSGDDTTMFVSSTGQVDTIQWQVDMGGGFVDLVNGALYQGVNLDTLSLLNLGIGQNNYIYQAVLSNSCGTIETAGPITLNVFQAPNVDLTDTIRACEGQSVFITPTSVTGSNITYQWQIFTGGLWQDLIDTGAYSNTTAGFLGIGGSIVNASLNNTPYRLVINTSCGEAISNTSYLFVTPSPSFTVPPANDTVCVGDTAVLSATVANGLTFTWQSNAGGPFANLSNGLEYDGVNTTSLSIYDVNSADLGVLYRLRVTGDFPCASFNSAVAQVFIGGDTILVNNTSSSFTYCNGLDTNLFVNYSGTADSIIWQVNTGGGFVNLSTDAFHSNVNTDSLQLTGMDASLDGNIYRAILANDCGSADTSDFVLTNLYDLGTITSSPVSQVGCEGDSISLYISTGSPYIAVEWQVWNGVTYVPITPSPAFQGINTDTLTINPLDLSMDGDSFNIELTDSCGVIQSLSTPIVLQVNPNIVNTVFVTICNTDSLTLSDGTSVNAAGIYFDTIAIGSTAGCDSVVEYNLSVFPLVSGNQSITICFGDSLQLADGSFVNATGIYNDTIVNGASNGCDSIHIIDLTVDPIVQGNSALTLCFGDSLQLSDGSFVNASGLYNDTIPNAAANGCDSLHIFNLTIAPLNQTNATANLCFGDSLQLSDGSFVTAPGIYNDTLTAGALNGCDSIHVIDLSIDLLIQSNQNVTICFGDSFQLSDGSFVNTTGIFNDTVSGGSVGGCDSVHIIDLTVSPIVQGSSNVTLCFGDSLQLSDGSFVNSSGTYNDTIPNAAANACDSLHVFNLTISPIVQGSSNVTLCFGDSLQLSDGSFVNASGTYNDTIPNAAANACDSLHVFNLTISPIVQGSNNVTLCFGDSLQLSDGSFVNTSGSYNDTIPNAAANGCDSLHVFNITISPIVQGSSNVTLCFGDSLQLSDGSFVNTSGSYNDTIPNAAANGCDSLHVFNLTISPIVQGSNNVTLCFGDSLQLSDGSFVNTSGTYNDTIPNAAANGCDSLHVFNLTISPIVQGSNNVTLCFGDSLQLSDGSFVNASGSYNDTIPNAAANACDSLHVFNLTISPIVQGSSNVTLCFGDSLQLSDGSFVNASGSYNDTIPNAAANACDSLHVFNLTISPIVQGSSNVTLCFGDSLQLSDGSFVNTSGSYNDTIPNAASNGCDSLHIFNLTINPLNQTNASVSICFGDSLQLSDGSFVNTTGIYNDTLIAGASNGCDSIHVIDLSIDLLIQTNENIAICFGDSFQLSDGSFVNVSGVYNDTVLGGSVGGCDSVHVIDLTISPLVQGTSSVTLCFGDSLQLSDGSFVNTSGIYNDTIANAAANACDSLHVFDLTISPLVQGVSSIALCFGDSFQLSDGSLVFTSGIYNDTLSGAAASGCDSIQVFNVLIAPIIQGSSNVTLCAGDSLQLSDGSFVNNSGAYNDTIPNAAANGCDSLHVFNLTISPIVQGSSNVTLCFGDSLQLSDGSFVNTSGVYNDTIPNAAANACDSLHIITLTISPLVQGNSSVTLCFGDSLQLSDGSFVNVTGIYNDTIANAAANACDSLHVFDLTISPIVQGNSNVVLCFGDSLQLSDGSFVNTSGIYNDTIVNAAANGCDSLHVFDLTISPIIQGNSNVSLCFGDSLQLSDGSFVNTSGAYNDTIANAATNGCDSLHIFNLTINPFVQGNTSVSICFGDSFQLSDGSFVDTSGIYNDTIIGGAFNTCDSVHIVDLTVDPLIQTNSNVSLCFGDSLQLSDGSFVNISGVYNDTILGGASNTCDSTHTFNLTISPLIQEVSSVALCSGDSLQLSDGSYVFTSGIFNDTITGGASSGCDSIQVFNVLIVPLAQGTSNDTLCFGDSLQLSNGTFVNTSGSYNDTIIGGSTNGCDSVYVLDLFISPLAQGSSNDTLCFGESLVLSDGTFVNSSGIYNDTISAGSANGCDSLHVFNLTIRPLVQGSSNDTLCFGDSLQLSDGSFVNSSGVYNDTIPNAATNGCDSLHVFNLTISPLVQGNSNVTLCFGDSLQLSNGSFVNTSGIYNDTLIAGALNGCDSVHTINLSIPAQVQSNNNVNLCFGDSLQLSDGSFVNVSGVYNDTLFNASSSGCDSVNIITLTIDSLIQTSETTNICFGDSLQLSNGSFVNVSGIYNDTIIGGASNGCDSIYTVDLTVDTLIQSNTSTTICFGDSFQLSSGNFVNASGIYNDTILAGAGNGCDSLSIINLTISPLITDTTAQVLCAGDSFVLSNGTVVNSAGLFPDTLLAANACDSVLFFDVSILPTANAIDTQSICNGSFYLLPNGDTATVSGVYLDTLVAGSSNGCDSIIQTDLFVLPNPDTLLVDSFCSGLTYTLASGLIVANPGVYNDTLFAGASNGCDSLLTYNLTLFTLPAPLIQLDTICFNESYTLANGVQVNTTGFYQDTISGLSGCDSIVAVDLFVRPANSILQQENSLLLCSGEDALFYAESSLTDVSYQWLENGTPIPGENNDTLLVSNVSILNDGTSYQLAVVSPCDTVFSVAAQLNVRSFANITANPSDTSLCEGEVANFSVTVDIPIAQFQWYENGSPIPGATNSNYSTGPVTVAQDGSQFFVAITDSCGNIDSSTIAIISITPNAVLVSQAPDLAVCVGDDASFYVNATGSNLSYQWLENGVTMPGETNDTLFLPNTTQAMNGNQYACQINSACGNLISTAMLLLVNDSSVLTNQSSDIEQCGGFSFEVFIEASNIASYQWQINQGGGFVNLSDGALAGTTIQILGSNTAVLTVSNFDLSITGTQFQVVTTVNCGQPPVFTPITVTVTEPENGIVTLEDTVLCLAEVNPIFVPYVDGAAQWSNGDFGQFVLPESTGDYVVNFTDANGCPRQDTIFIELEDCIAQCVVTAPTGFTPNASGANDIFRAIYTCDLSFFELQLYNRYGEMVYMTNEPLQGWDGVFKGTNAEIGVYQWYIRYQKEGADNIEDIKGNVTLIR